MSNSNTSGSDIFDVRKIRRLVELMNEHELSEIDLRQRDQRIRLRRGHDPIIQQAAVAAPLPAAPPVAAAAQPAPSSTQQPAEAVAEEAHITHIKSPMVGTFYPASNPDAAPFVKVGDTVNAETTVCIIEAMKVFNEIPAECTGKIAAVLVENGEPVEFGQSLFKVDTRQ